MNIKDVRIEEDHNRPGAIGGTLYDFIPRAVMSATDFYTPDMTGNYHKGTMDPDCPLVGVMTEDGEHCIDDFISGAERLRVFLHWVAIKYGENWTSKQLREYWKEFEKYENNHLMDLYVRPVRGKLKSLYATWSQVEEWHRYLIEGDDDVPEDGEEPEQETALS